MAEDIRHWLEAREFGKYADTFRDNEVDLQSLPFLTDADLRELGVALGTRRRMMSAIAQYVAGENGDRGSDHQLIHRQVTVLFADLCNFTRLSKNLGAEQTHKLLNTYFSAVDDVVAEFGGTVDKHIGDAVMAVFGAPQAHTDDPERALRAAMDIHKKVAALDPPLTVHIGVASGQVLAGHTGSVAHREYTVTGDSVNLAARLTDLAAPRQTFVSSAVKNALGARFHGEMLAEQLIDGLQQPITIWRLGRISSHRGASSYPFVGRRENLDLFASGLDASAAQNKGCIFLVKGEAGIGKTRLTDEFEKIARTREFTCLTGLVLDFGTAKGQDAIQALVRGLLSIIPGSQKKQRQVALDAAIEDGLINETRRVFMNDLLDLTQPPDLRGIYDAMDNKSRNEGKREALADLAIALSRRTPLLLKIEDIHWADPVILSHIGSLARAAIDNPFALVLTTRIVGNPFEVTSNAMLSGFDVTPIDLAPLNTEEAAKIAVSFNNLEDGLVETCIERAEGNPLYLDQLLRNADEIVKGQVPGTVQGIVQARLDLLPEKDRIALQAASVLGQGFSSEALEAVLSGVVFDPSNLLTNALIRPVDGGFHFAHALIKDGVYASLLSSRCHALHRKAAEFYESSDLMLRAEHLEMAEDPHTASAYLDAARHQMLAYRYDVALKIAKKALEFDCDPATRFELNLLSGDLSRHLAELESAVDYFRATLELAEDDIQFCKAHLGLATALRIVDQSDEALACLAKIQNVATKSNFIDVLAEIHFLRGNLYFPKGKIAECEEEHQTSLRYAKEINSFESEARALGGLGDAAYGSGHMLTAHGYFEKCVALAEEHDFTRIAVANSPMLAWTSMFQNDFKMAADIAKKAVDRSVATADKRAGLIGHMCLSELFFCNRDFSHMEQHGVKSKEAILKIETVLFRPAFLITTGRYQQYLEKDYAAAMQTYKDAYEICQQTSESFMGPWILGAIATCARDLEELDWALREGERLLKTRVVSHNHFFFYVEAIEACTRARKWTDVARYADALAEFTADEPLGWCDMHIDAGRALAALGLAGLTDDNTAKLVAISGQAKQIGQLGIQQLIDETLAELA